MPLVSPQAGRFLTREFFLCHSSIPSLNKYRSFLFDLLVCSLRLNCDQSHYFFLGPGQAIQLLLFLLLKEK